MVKRHPIPLLAIAAFPDHFTVLRVIQGRLRYGQRRRAEDFGIYQDGADGKPGSNGFRHPNLVFIPSIEIREGIYSRVSFFSCNFARFIYTFSHVCN
ncbi:Uncharacterised protein [Mycobacteroides abscessus subsp. abscessus]|nr:Uncharacterised protein [Mycobacteroides abscessus subsp. abscessus]